MTVRLYPTAAQESRLFDYLRTGRRAWNHFLEQRIKAWNRRKESVTCYQQMAMLTKWRANDPAIASVPADVERDAIRRLDLAFAAFFRRCKAGEKPGFPRFKSANRWNSCGFLRAGNYVKDDRIAVPKLGFIACRNLRAFTGAVKSLRIVRRAGRWFAQLLIDDKQQSPPPRTIRRATGFDLGLKSFLVGSDGFHVPPPRYFRAFEKRLARLCRRVSRKKKGSRNRRKAVARLQRLHLKISDSRSDFTHKLSKEIVQAYDLIVLENLNVKGMAQGRLAKSILDAAWSQFTSQVRYKAENAGATVIEVDPRGTSQECSGCHQTVPKTLAVRIHRCDCGLVLDRDLNAARNILRRGIETLNSGGRPVRACGVGQRADVEAGSPATHC